MFIEDHTYKLHYSGDIIIRDEGTPQEMQIPVSEDNWAYQQYVRWEAIPGNDAEPADPAPAPDPNEEADKKALSDMRSLYLQMINGVNDIQATTAQLTQHANTLSTITITGLTLVQLENNLQPVLRALGTDLGTIIDNVDKLAKGSERMLKTLAALQRNLGRG